MELGSLESRHPEIYAELLRLRLTLESHYKQPCEIEFCIEQGRLYVLGVRPAKMSVTAHAKTAIDFLAEGLISPEEAILQIPLDFLKHTLAPRIVSFDAITLIARGLPASAGSATGVAAFDEPSALRFAHAGHKVILIVPELTPDLIAVLYASAGVLTTRGGLTSHAAVVARGAGRPCVVGAGSIKIDKANARAIVDHHSVKSGDLITIDGSAGAIYLGAPPIESKWWWDDPVASAVAALVENVLRVGSNDENVLTKCWRLRDAFAHNDMRGFGLRRAHWPGARVEFKDVPSHIASLLPALRGWEDGSSETVCLALSCLIDGLSRVLGPAAGLGRHPDYFRPLWDPLVTKIENVQLVGFEYFGINRFARYWIDLATVKIVLKVTLADDEPSWYLDRTNLDGASLAAGSLGVLAWAIWVNEAQISPAEIVTLMHFIRSREHGWKWFEINDVTYDQLRQFLTADPHPRSRDSQLYQKCLQLGLVREDRLTTIGESLVNVPDNFAPTTQTTEEIVERATGRVDELITAVIQRGYATRSDVLDDYTELVRRREFREAIITNLYETRFSSDRHEFDYALLRELVDSVASIPAVAYVAGAVTAGVVGNAAYDVIKRIATAISERFDEHDRHRAAVWQGVADDAQRIEAFFQQHSIATAEEISVATDIERDKLLPLLKLLGFTYDRGKGRNGWTHGPKRSTFLPVDRDRT